MKTVVITGAGGFIGGTITEALLKKGVNVIGVDRNKDSLSRFMDNKGFIPVIADFSQYDDLCNIIHNDEIDVFYHFAWQGVFGEAFKDFELQLNNARYSCSALREAIKLKCKKFVIAGTVNEYEVMRFMSDNLCAPRYTAIYATCKIAAEMICKTIAHNSDIDFCAGILPMVYGGKYNYSKMIPYVVVSQLIKGKPLSLISGEEMYDFVSVNDVADAFCAIGENGKTQTSYYIGHRKLKKFKEWIMEMRDIVAPGAELNFGGYPGSLNIDFSYSDPELLYRDTGFECKREMKDELPQYVEWLRSVNFLEEI